ncbi:GntR family transcriptional regulator [Microbacterium pumilum]|uniref:GntR family transcriptional regulator n=1 Tax=Microbacterium pumilum TaxID=344165 RepID=A0ABP5EHP2_9MICO
MITLDPQSTVVPFEQVRGQITDLIRSGNLTGGQRLPAIRQLAADLRVAPGTVAKAYSILESEGLIETSRTRGTRVAPGNAHPQKIQRAAKRYVNAIGDLDLDQTLSAVRTAWLAMHTPTPTSPAAQDA